jgi:hypothetical protein
VRIFAVIELGERCVEILGLPCGCQRWSFHWGIWMLVDYEAESLGLNIACGNGEISGFGDECGKRRQSWILCISAAKYVFFFLVELFRNAETL